MTYWRIYIAHDTVGTETESHITVLLLGNLFFGVLS